MTDNFEKIFIGPMCGLKKEVLTAKLNYYQFSERKSKSWMYTNFRIFES